jgi:DNA-binding NarL/FixJ family response regulator
VRLPDGSGLDAVKKLRAMDAQMGIVVLTMYAGDEHLFGALEAGAGAMQREAGVPAVSVYVVEAIVIVVVLLADAAARRSLLRTAS